MLFQTLFWAVVKISHLKGFQLDISHTKISCFSLCGQVPEHLARSRMGQICLKVQIRLDRGAKCERRSPEVNSKSRRDSFKHYLHRQLHSVLEWLVARSEVLTPRLIRFYFRSQPSFIVDKYRLEWGECKFYNTAVAEQFPEHFHRSSGCGKLY